MSIDRYITCEACKQKCWISPKWTLIQLISFLREHAICHSFGWTSDELDDSREYKDYVDDSFFPFNEEFKNKIEKLLEEYRK